jgi:predicted RNA-binding Zn-ribbon protein involved in translation (DUF1610 family)
VITTKIQTLVSRYPCLPLGHGKRVRIRGREWAPYGGHARPVHASVSLASMIRTLARPAIPLLRARSLFTLFKRAPSKPESRPILSQDDLFHPFSASPFPAIAARGEAIKSLAPCPVCASHHDHIHAHTKAQPRAVAFECPDCGWPTHCTEEHWHADKDHSKYCSRLREVNEDEHDLRSGRRLREFELPGAFPGISEPRQLTSFCKCRSQRHGSCHIFL